MLCNFYDLLLLEEEEDIVEDVIPWFGTEIFKFTGLIDAGGRELYLVLWWLWMFEKS